MAYTKAGKYLLALILVASAPAAAQRTVSLLKGFDSRLEVQAGIYVPDAAGSQASVREFDGRDLNGLGIESINAYGYNNAVQYWFTLRDIGVGDGEYVGFGLMDANRIKLTGSTSELRHRFAPVPAANPWVAEQLSKLTPAVPPPVEGQTWDTVKDLSPGSVYGINRRVNQLGLCVTPDSRQRSAFLLDWWQEEEKGSQQLLFRARQAAPGVINNRQRGSVLLPVGRDTGEASIGTDLAIGKNSVLNYRFVNTRFEDNRASFGSALNFLPLNSLTCIGSETKSHVIKARSRISRKLDFTGVHISRERSNARSDIPQGYYGAGSPMDKREKITSTNAALVYRPSGFLSFTGRWRELRRDNRVPPIYTGTDAPGDTPANDTLGSDTESFELEGVFTGIRRAYIRGGYERRSADLKPGELSEEHVEIILPATATGVDWDIYRASLRCHPFGRLNLSGNYERWSCADSGFTGAPNNRRRTAANATYMLRDNAAVYGDFSRWHEFNDQIRVAGEIPTAATNDEEEHLREQAAGQGLDSEFSTAMFGGWYAVTDRLTFDINFGKVIMDSGATWVLGTDPAFLPHLPADFVAFKSSTEQWSLGTNYRMDARHSFYCRFTHADSDGASLVDPDKFAGLGPEWTPVSVKQKIYTLGFARSIGRRDTLSLDLSRSRWDDGIDAGQSGSYQLWRLSWYRQY